MKIPVAFITDKNFVMQTGVAIYSLFINKKPETIYDVFIIMAECDEEAEREIRKVENEQIGIHIIRVSLDMYRDIKQMSHIPISCLLKFNLCDYITEYDKIIYLDGDIYVRGDLTELYEYDLQDNYLAGVPSLDMTFDDRKLVNAGIILFDCKKMRDSHMSDILIAKRRELGDRGSMDQQTFNMVMSDRMGFLSYKYNCVANKLLGTEKKNFPVQKVNALYGTQFKNNKELVQNAIIIHYATGGKPWKYSYIVCADEWYKCFLKSPYGNIKLSRQSYVQAHLAGIKRNLKEGGLKALYRRLIWYIKNYSGKNEHNSWG